MNRRILSAIAAMALLMAACAGTRTPPPALTPRGEDRFLVDPRAGYTQTAPPQVERKFDSAWRFFLAGNDVEARRRVADIRLHYPEYLPAALAEAAVDIRQGQLDSARVIVQRVEDQAPDYTAARIYEAEIALAEHHARAAYDIYRALSERPNAPPTVAERVSMLKSRVFEELVVASQTAADDEAARLLREALEINASALNARILLANKLIARRSFEEARQVLEPVISSPDFDRPEVQESLAEIEAGRGQYQEAIARYDRLARSDSDPRFSRRLEQIKQAWTAANMPPQYQRAIESESIDRADLAVLMYWKLTSVRFAQNLGSPPIAIDIEGVPGREEMIRAIAIGLYDVDPVTRRVAPLRTVNAATLQRLAARLLSIRGAVCARSLPDRDAQRILTACAVTDPAGNVPPETPVTGRAAAALLDQVQRVLER